jgi:hypothetical protein
VILDKTIEQVETFNYLGCFILYSYESDLEHKPFRLQDMCGNVKKTPKNKTIKVTLIKLYNGIAVPMLMCGSENWARNRSERRKIEAVEMRILRRVSGYRLTYHVRNTQCITNTVKLGYNVIKGT